MTERVLRVATFNAGLAVGVLPYATERLPKIIAALAALDVDLLFVQEIWLDSHWQDLTAKLRDTLPFTLRQPSLTPPEPCACTSEEVAPLIACIRASCGGLRDEALARCAVSSCAETIMGMSPKCLRCIASDPSGTLDDIVARCVGADQSENAEGRDGGAFFDRLRGVLAYGGSFGTGVLARTPFVDPDHLVYASTVNARGASFLRLSPSDSGQRSIAVIATHLSPGGAEQAPQVSELVRWIDGKCVATEPAVLLGDLNCSPGSSLYQQIERAGFHGDTDDRAFTYSSSALGASHLPSRGWRLDHVLVRGDGVSITSERALDVPTLLWSEGKRVATMLSDHFAVVGTVRS